MHSVACLSCLLHASISGNWQSPPGTGMRSDLVRLCFQDEKEVSPLNRFVPCCSHVWTNREDGEPLNKRGKKKVQHLDRIVASCLAPHTIVACLLDCLLACLLAWWWWCHFFERHSCREMQRPSLNINDYHYYNWHGVSGPHAKCAGVWSPCRQS